MNQIPTVPIYTPDDEPYLGQALLLQLDQEICAIMEQNSKTAPRTHNRQLNEYQKMACVLIPQAISIALSIRELVRQAYLFGASVLLRSFIERSAILLYLKLYPEQIDKWKRGWQSHEAPTLAQMLDGILKKHNISPEVKGRDMTASMNSLLHGKPDSTLWNTIEINLDSIGYAPSKITNRNDLCDEICAHTIPWLVIVHAMMLAYFPENSDGLNNRDNDLL